MNVARHGFPLGLFLCLIFGGCTLYAENAVADKGCAEDATQPENSLAKQVYGYGNQAELRQSSAGVFSCLAGYGDGNAGTSAADTLPKQKVRADYQLYAGYSWLSNSFNGTPGSRQPLNGWNAGAAFQDWHHVRFKLDYSMFTGENKGDPQHAFLIMGGAQYGTVFHRERLFAEALLGEAGLNGTWFSTDTTGFKNGHTGSHASLAEFLGGGIDTPISFSCRGPHRGRCPAYEFCAHFAASRRRAISPGRRAELFRAFFRRHCVAIADWIGERVAVCIAHAG